MQETQTTSSQALPAPAVRRLRAPLVLVSYVAVVRSAGSTRCVREAIALRCERSHELRPLFEAHMRKRQRTEFPYILEWEMTGYLPDHCEANW